MTEYEKARAWRRRLNLTQTQLGAALGYSKESICWFEKGQVPPGRSENKEIKAWVWQRYKLACAGYQAQLDGATFQWGES